jgi:hypothetical protein
MLAEATGGDIAIAVVATVGVVATAMSPVLVVLLRRTGKLETHANEAAASAKAATVTAAAATVNAASAATAASEIKQTLGVPNGNGNVTQMLERLLGESAETKAWQNNAGLWMSEHDEVDAQTRSDVTDIKTYLGMPSKPDEG